MGWGKEGCLRGKMHSLSSDEDLEHPQLAPAVYQKCQLWPLASLAFKCLVSILVLAKVAISGRPIGTHWCCLGRDGAKGLSGPE